MVCLQVIGLISYDQGLIQIFVFVNLDYLTALPLSITPKVNKISQIDRRLKFPKLLHLIKNLKSPLIVFNQLLSTLPKSQLNQPLSYDIFPDILMSDFTSAEGTSAIVSQVLLDAQEAEGMAAQGREWAEEEFEADGAVQFLEGGYCTELLGGGKPMDFIG